MNTKRQPWQRMLPWLSLLYVLVWENVLNSPIDCLDCRVSAQCGLGFMRWFWTSACLPSSLFEVIEEGGQAFESLFLLSFYLQLELYLRLAYAAYVGYVVKACRQAHTLSGEHRLAKSHLVHAIVDKHLDVVHLDDFLPKVWKEGKGEIAMSNGRLVWAFHLGAISVHVNPLVVEGGVGKEVDALL